MITELEISPSNRANCCRCSKTIVKGVLRGMSDNIYNSYNYFCDECSYKIILEGIDDLTEMKIKLEITGIPKSRNLPPIIEETTK